MNGSACPWSPLNPCEYEDRKSTRLNSSHLVISYAVFCLKKKNTPGNRTFHLTPLFSAASAAACPRISETAHACQAPSPHCARLCHSQLVHNHTRTHRML